MSSGGTLAWAGIVLVGAALLAPNLGRSPGAPPATPDSLQISRIVTPVSPQNHAGTTLHRAPDGHFYADAMVNGAEIRFIVDTGASVVALSRDDAQRAGIALPAERLRAMGAGGEIEVMPVTVDRIALGPIEAHEVPAVVGEQLPISLLGQSFLGKVGAVEIRGDTMTLR